MGKLRILVCAFLLCSSALAEGQNTYYVSMSGSDLNDGTAWSTAFRHLQTALRSAVAGDTVLVAEGVYFPDEGFDQTEDARSSTFNLASGTVLLGGFRLDSLGPPLRDPELYRSVLSGDLMQNDTSLSDMRPLTDPNRQDNAHHVVTCTDGSQQTIIDGFEIRSGQADSAAAIKYGGGILIQGGAPLVTACAIRSNAAIFGGGVAYYRAGQARIAMCQIVDNDAELGGGVFYYKSDGVIMRSSIDANTANGGSGMYNEDSRPIVLASNLRGNAGKNGAGIYNEYSDALLVNCVFQCNAASAFGGAIYNHYSSPKLLSCTLGGNYAARSGGALRNSGISRPLITNSIIWKNSSALGNDPIVAMPNIRSTILQDGCPLWTNCRDVTSADPMFMRDPDFNRAPVCTGKLNLRFGSPAINNGSNPELYQDIFDIDFDGDTTEATPDMTLFQRIFDNTTDIGAYENPDGRCPEVLTVTADYNPLNGHFTARQKIVLDHGVIVDSTSKVMLNSPHIEIMAGAAVRIEKPVTIRGEGCEN